MKLDFVRGHCGHDCGTLLAAAQIPVDRELEVALKVLDLHTDSLEVGLLRSTGVFGEVSLRVVDTTTRDWVPMCGGITQLVGMALTKSTWSREGWFPVNFGDGTGRMKLITDSGVIPIQIKGDEVITTMDSYVARLYEAGVKLSWVHSVPVFEVDEFLVIHVGALSRYHTGIDFTKRDEGLDVIDAMLRESDLKMAMLYDESPAKGGDYRVYSRFLDDTAKKIPYEFQCGTGAVAILLAIEATFFEDGRTANTLTFEWGNPDVTYDPFGVRTSTLRYERKGAKVTRVQYSHSVIAIVEDYTLEIS